MRRTKFALILALLFCVTFADAQTTYWPTFLERDQYPNGVLYLPAPPDTMSAEFVSDLVWHHWGRKMRNDSLRAAQAHDEASLENSSFCRWLSGIIDVELSEDLTPETAKLISYVVSDACQGTKKTKLHHERKRPFVYLGDGTLIPEEEESHHTPSYPSSHATSGWAVALVMVELFPEYQDALLKWGYEFGDSRIIAGYHYRTDVEAGRLVASAVVARLHADHSFCEQMKKARKEIEKRRK